MQIHRVGTQIRTRSLVRNSKRRGHQRPFESGPCGTGLNVKTLCRGLLVVLLLFCSAGAMAAGEQTPPPLGMTQAQFDQFLDTLSRAGATKPDADPGSS